MAVEKKSLFNRIINIYFLNKDGGVIDQIICPKKGRKPDIEIVGTLQASLQGGAIPEFNITVKNLYMNLAGAQYTNIKVEAGYENNLVSFKGQIVSIFQESPGPDGKTVIMCQLGQLENWLTTQIDLDEEAGAKLTDILQKISKSLNFKANPKIPPALETLTLPDRFTMNGTASDVINKLLQQFPEKELHLTEKDGAMYLYSLKTDEVLNQRYINFLSSPPQKNVGGDDGSYYTVFTAPWDPGVTPGTKVIFPAWQYVKFFNVVNAGVETNALIAVFVQVHFGTCGSVNQMQVQGMGVKV